MPRKRLNPPPLAVRIEAIPSKDARQRWAAFLRLLITVADRLENNDGASPPHSEDAPSALHDNPTQYTPN